MIRRLLVDQAWQREAGGGTLLDQWPSLIGPERAPHWNAIQYDAPTGTLTVVCTSDAWATILRLLEHEVIAQIAQKHPHIHLRHIKVRRT